MSASSNNQTNELFPGIDLTELPEDFLATLEQFDQNEEAIPLQPLSECLAIIAQPFCSSKVRYRNDYLFPSKRRDPLTNKTSNSTYNGPAVIIPTKYLNPTKEYYIGVSLATVTHERTNCKYVHPYEIESIDHQERNDRPNNIVWFPIVDEDRNGIKSFQDIRIVRKTEDELESYGNLHPFHCQSNVLNNVVPQVLSKRKIVPEYNLKKAQLAFCIGQKRDVNDRFPIIIDPDLIIFSDDMTLISDEGTVEDDRSTESVAKSNPSPPPECPMYKYAPRYGPTKGEEEILICYERKLEEKKYGKLQIMFQSDTPNIDWSAEVNDIEVKDKIVSFRTPRFPFSITTLTAVKIILQQRDRRLESLQYFYTAKSQCVTCQATMKNTPKPIVRMNSNKRPKSSMLTIDDDESDAIVPVPESNPILRQSKSEPEANSSNSTTRSSINTTKTNNNEDPFYTTVRDSIELLFTKNDFKPLLRSCRLFVRKRPELLHQAIGNNYSDLLSTFVPVAGTELLQHKNQFGETALLHAARLNQADIIKALLERKNSNELLEDNNNKKQNIFHILALNTDSDSILDLFIDHLLKNSINISEKFDQIDEDNHTPLQLAIRNNNLSATRHLLKYFDKTVYDTSSDIGDNLIHLAVRYGDLTMLKYLLNDGQLIEQGNRSNLSMTPIELARTMKHDEMVEYFKEIYSQPEINEAENSDND